MSTQQEFLSRINVFSENTALVLLENMIWPVLLATALVILATVPATFTNVATIQLMLFTMVPLGLIVLAESICLLSGHFDLSVGAIAGFSAVFTAMVMTEWGLLAHPVAGILLILVVGSAIGFTNGVFIAKLGVNPFLQTLAFLIIFGGGKLALTTQPLFDLPGGYLYPGDNRLTAIGILVVSFVVMALVLKYTNFGRAIYAVGSNKESARAVGINTDRVVIAVYTLSGFFCGIAGLMLTGFINAVPPDIADDMVFPAFAAAIIGGVSLFGGRGKLLGAFGGVLLLSLIQTALNVAGTDPTVIGVVEGVVLFAAILLYTTKSRVRERILSSEVAS